MAQILIGQGDIQDVVLIGDLNLIFVILFGNLTGLLVCMSPGAGSGLRPIPDLDLFLKLQLILKLKKRM